MTTLKELLEGLQIDTNIDNPDNKSKEDEVDISKIKLDDIPEAQRPIFKKLIDTVDVAGNELAKANLVIKTMKDSMNNINNKDTNKNDKKDNSGDTDEEKDPYLKEIKSLREEIQSLRNIGTQNKENTWEESVKDFAKDHPDVVKFATEIDKIRSQFREDSPYYYNIAELYNLAKQSTERRETIRNNKKEELSNQNNANRNRTEHSGLSNDKVVDLPQFKSLNEAFDSAVKTISSGK